ncbi:anti-sigma factor [Corynebacterium glyciniphilum]|uniref:anti-sigma factor n=1 Tax=Corynebacterium glyciniphilum TaxID=1404244 RepID=UPI0011AB7875|nr:anti-sigma factor [Corynebacterium glyciniphilum]
MTGPDRDRAVDRTDELLVGLALDALDSAQDVREAEALAASDPDAAAALRHYREVAAQLAAVHETAPPPEVKEAVMRRLAEDGAGAPDAQAASIPTVAQLRDHRRYRRTAWLMTAVAAVSLAVAVPSLMVAISQHNTSVRAEDTTREITRMLTSPGASVASERVGDGGQGSLAVVAAGGEMTVIARDLPGVDDNRVYQLWALDDAGEPTSAGLFTGSDGVISVGGGNGTVGAGAAAMAVTEEPAGGSSAPTSDPVVVLAVDGSAR